MGLAIDMTAHRSGTLRWNPSGSVEVVGFEISLK